MNKALRGRILSAFNFFGINGLCRPFYRRKILILWYHGICDDGFDLLRGYDERHIPVSLFREQLTYLKRKKYTFISLSDIPEIISNKKKVKNPVVLTFDDGFKNVLRNAYPIMQELRAKGCIYIVTDLIGTNNLLWTDYVETIIRNSSSTVFTFIYKNGEILYEIGTREQNEYAMRDIKARLRKLSDSERKEHLKQFENTQLYKIPSEFLMTDWDELKKLDSRVLEVGCHTKGHPNCDTLTTVGEFEEEIKNSKIHIEQMLELPIRHFCYPAGTYNEEVVEYVMKCGYETATTVENGFNYSTDNLFKLKRVFIDEDLILFKAYVSGSYFLIKRVIGTRKN